MYDDCLRANLGNEMNKGKQITTSVLAALFLMFSFVGIGFGVVSGSPEPTRIVASATIDDSSSPFSKEELVQGAVATQEYSFSTHDLQAYKEVIAQMNVDADTPYSQYGPEQISDAPEQYTVTNDAISHLNDVYSVADRLLYPILAIMVMAAFLLMSAYRFFGLNAVADSLIWGGIATLVFILVLAIWAFASFNSLFAVFHSMFFAEGTWTFPADSLLITMLPTDFWMGIALFWALVSAVISIVSIVIGIVAKVAPREKLSD